MENEVAERLMREAELKWRKTYLMQADLALERWLKIFTCIITLIILACGIEFIRKCEADIYIGKTAPAALLRIAHALDGE